MMTTASLAPGGTGPKGGSMIITATTNMMGRSKGCMQSLPDFCVTHILTMVRPSDIPHATAVNKRFKRLTIKAAPTVLTCETGLTGSQLLHLAVRAKDFGQCTALLVKSLLKEGAGIDYEDRVTGMTPLMASVRIPWGLPAVHCLLNNGANIGYKSKRWNGRTAIHIAARCGNLEMIMALFKLCPEFTVHDEDTHGGTVLHYSCMSQNFETNRFLVDALGARVEKRDNQGHTPLSQVTCHNQLLASRQYLHHHLDLSP